MNKTRTVVVGVWEPLRGRNYLETTVPSGSQPAAPAAGPTFHLPTVLCCVTTAQLSFGPQHVADPLSGSFSPFMPAPRALLGLSRVSLVRWILPNMGTPSGRPKKRWSTSTPLRTPGKSSASQSGAPTATGELVETKIRPVGRLSERKSLPFSAKSHVFGFSLEDSSSRNISDAPAASTSSRPTAATEFRREYLLRAGPFRDAIPSDLQRDRRSSCREEHALLPARWICSDVG